MPLLLSNTTSETAIANAGARLADSTSEVVEAAASMYMIFTRRRLKAQNFELHLSDRAAAAARADDETRNGSKAMEER